MNQASCQGVGESREWDKQGTCPLKAQVQGRRETEKKTEIQVNNKVINVCDMSF